MSTELDIAKRLYRGKTVAASGSRGAAVAGGVVGTPSGDTQVRYGYATADSAGGWVTVKLDTSASAISCVCDSPIKSGQRVAVITTSAGQLKAQPIGQNIVDEAVGEATKDVAQQIQDAGDKILDQVNGEMDEWKQDHQLTDADINHSIQTAVSGATETWEGQLSSVENNIETNYALKTEVTQGIDGLRSEISETYATSEGVSNEINTAIEQASGEISSTVEQNVINSVGETFATKTELTQTSSSLTLSITQATGKAEDAQSDATEALDKANEVSAYFQADSTGLEIGQENEPASVKMNSSGAFQVLKNGRAVMQVRSSESYGITYIETVNDYVMDLVCGGTIVMVSDGYVTLTNVNGHTDNLGDWVSDTHTSGNWTVQRYASGYCVLCGTVSMNFPNGGSTLSVSLPVTFRSATGYTVQLQLVGGTSAYADHFNDISLMAHSFTTRGFVIGAWNASGTSISNRYRVSVMVTGFTSA